MTRQVIQVLVLCLLLSGTAHGAATEECSLAFEHGHMSFPVDQLTSESRCLLAEVIDHPSASGVIGPDRTPIGLELYAYLLDHPAVTAMLMQRMGMGSFQLTPQGPNRYWVNDGDGAEGLLELVFRDARTRIYFIDGRHRSALFPTMKAKTAVFLRMMDAAAAPGRSTVQTTLASYTKFEEGMLARLLHLFQPLVTRAVNRTLTKEFSMTHRLGLLIAEQPQRVLREAAGLSEATPEDRQSLLALLRTEAALFDPANAPR